MSLKYPYVPNYRNRGIYTKGHQYELNSPKIKNRSLHLFTKTEFQHYLLIESDPEIEIFCEQPDLNIVSFIDNKRIEANFDMWIKWKNGREEFRRIVNHQYKEVFENDPKKKPKLLALSNWSEKNEIDFEIYTDKMINARPILLDNWSEILPYFHDISWIIENGLHNAVLLFIQKHKNISIRNIIEEFIDIETTELIRAIFWNLYIGKISADLERVKLSQNLLLEAV